MPNSSRKLPGTLSPVVIPNTGEETPVVGHKRSRESSPLSSGDPSAGTHPTWVILNRVGTRGDYFHRDLSSWATSRTSTDEEIGVSFELVEPPGTSLLILHWPQGPYPRESSLYYPNLMAAHGNKVLFEITVSSNDRPPSTWINYFVYKAISDPSPQSQLSLLPTSYWSRGSSAGQLRQRIMNGKRTGIMSRSMESFVVAELVTGGYSVLAADLWLFCSEYGRWKVFENLPIHNAGNCDMFWWTTDTTVCDGQQIIWVDYYRGMVFANLSNTQNPKLQYVPLPVEPVLGDPDHPDYGRGCPEATRSVCVSHSHIKFVIVDGVTDENFSIKTSSLSSNCTWTEEVTLSAGELWSLDSNSCFPHVPPKFPVVSIQNPDMICFNLSNDDTDDPNATTWMMEVDMKRKVLLSAIPRYKKGSLFHENTSMCNAERCSKEGSWLPTKMSGRSSKEGSSFHNMSTSGRPSKEGCLQYQHSSMSARRMSKGLSFIPSEIPYYLYGKDGKDVKVVAPTEAGQASHSDQGVRRLTKVSQCDTC